MALISTIPSKLYSFFFFSFINLIGCRTFQELPLDFLHSDSTYPRGPGPNVRLLLLPSALIPLIFCSNNEKTLSSFWDQEDPLQMDVSQDNVLPTPYKKYFTPLSIIVNSDTVSKSHSNVSIFTFSSAHSTLWMTLCTSVRFKGRTITIHTYSHVAGSFLLWTWSFH